MKVKLTRARKKEILRQAGWLEKPKNANYPRSRQLWFLPVEGQRGSSYWGCYYSWVDAWKTHVAKNSLLEISLLVEEACQ